MRGVSSMPSGVSDSDIGVDAAINDQYASVGDHHHAPGGIVVVDAQMVGRPVQRDQACVRAEGAILNKMCREPGNAIQVRGDPIDIGLVGRSQLRFWQTCAGRKQQKQAHNPDGAL
jgi:hypothetical protein